MVDSFVREDIIADLVDDPLSGVFAGLKSLSQTQDKHLDELLDFICQSFKVPAVGLVFKDRQALWKVEGIPLVYQESCSQEPLLRSDWITYNRFQREDLISIDSWNPQVAPTGLKSTAFCAGVRLSTSSKQILGGLIVVDKVVRSLADEDWNKLEFFARQIVIIINNYSLQQEAAWGHAMVEGSSYMILATKPDGTLTTFNATAEKTLGYSRDEVLGKASPLFLMDPESLLTKFEGFNSGSGQKFLTGFETLTFKARELQVDQHEIQFLHRDGRKIPVRMCVSPMLGNGPSSQNHENIIGYVIMAEDLTESHKMKALIEAQEVQIMHSAKMASLGEMAGGIAHEINNPLAIITGKSALIQRALAQGKIDSENLIRDIQKIEATTLRIAKIIKGLRAFARSSDQDPMTHESLAEVVQDTLELCQARFRNSQIEIVCQIDPSLKIHCRATQISQVVMNLLSNAYDAVKNQNEKWVRLEAELLGDGISIRFSDSGGPIPAPVVQRMMSPFFTTKDVGQGTGLGLSISASIAADHGGSLIYDEKSRTTCFILTLPRSQELSTDLPKTG